jgi:hypothetical protein
MRTTPSDAPLAPLSAVPRWARVTAVAVAALALTACSAGSSSSGGSSSDAFGAAAAPSAAGAAADGSTTDKAAGGTNVLGAAVASDRSIVVRAQSTVRVDDVPASTAKLDTLAAGHRATIANQATSDGIAPVPTDPQPADSSGTVAGSSACGSTGCTKGYASSVTTLRLDNDAVDGLLRDVAALGKVEATSRTSDDVTAEVADVAARVSNARASLARVRALMTKATTIADVVTLEAELSKREGDLEALEARQRTLADQSAQATVTVTLLSQEAPVAAAADETGFVAGLKQGWSAFTTAMVAGLTVVGALVPFLILLVPVALVLWFVRRRRSAARPATTVEGPPATA